jgi:predicted sugar kinase
MEGVYETLCERVDELIAAHKGQLLSTTGTDAAITELIARSEGLEKAIREIAIEVGQVAGRPRDVEAAQ